MRLNVLALFFFIVGTHAFCINKVTVGVGEWPPYISQTLEGGGPIAVKITRSFAAEGVAVSFKWYPWKRSFILAADNILDATAPWRLNPEIKNLFFISKHRPATRATLLKPSHCLS